MNASMNLKKPGLPYNYSAQEKKKIQQRIKQNQVEASEKQLASLNISVLPLAVEPTSILKNKNPSQHQKPQRII